jgi:hypothetical protein
MQEPHRARHCSANTGSRKVQLNALGCLRCLGDKQGIVFLLAATWDTSSAPTLSIPLCTNQDGRQDAANSRRLEVCCIHRGSLAATYRRCRLHGTDPVPFRDAPAHVVPCLGHGCRWGHVFLRHSSPKSMTNQIASE